MPLAAEVVGEDASAADRLQVSAIASPKAAMALFIWLIFVSGLKITCT